MSRAAVLAFPQTTFGRPRWSPDADVRFWVAALLSVAVLACWLGLLGRPLAPPSGLRLWSGDLARGNSQQLSDGYSLLHLSFGALIAALMRRYNPRLGGGRLALTVVLSAVVWEAVENLPPVITLFSAPAGAASYHGDSIVNSLGDVVFAGAGFVLARQLSWRGIVALLVGIELACALLIGDGLLWGSLRLAGLA
ncbi:DUF2585 family protein [Sphingomonas sp. BN140010]|uniref:DUF2585 family protein n=1 Tax=Sphingomonas arvum TaxID=2992113 RepID=A0ABT3JDF0_9SPHN|nr:DUF2585 family protein [Sphingomonas sp. BN140010]MCW3797097.1 DUF2585 family protein [Sphingomonas sp. BN140010]